MTVCSRSVFLRQVVCVVLLVLASSALGGCAADRASVDATEKLEKELEKLRGSMADIKKSLEEIKKLVEAIPYKRPGADDVRMDASVKARGGVQLTIVPGDIASAAHLAVVITVRNVGKKSFVWDREFSVFMRWNVKTDDGTVLKSESIADVERDAPEGWKSRFVAIAPGQSLSERVVLTTGFRKFFCGVGYSHVEEPLSPGIIPFGYQKLARFVIPEKTRFVSIQVEYIGVGGIGHPEMGFMHEFGVTPGDIGLLQQEVASNTINIPISGSDISPRP